MKKIVSILTGTLCAFTFSVSATEFAVDNTDVVVTDESQTATDSAVVEAATEEISGTNVPEEGVVSNETSPVVAVDEVPEALSADAVVPEVQTLPEPQKAPEPKKKGSLWDAILKIFKTDDPARTSEQAFNTLVEDQSIVMDFSNVTDFAQNGDAKMEEYWQKLVSTNSFGTKSPNIYVNLSNTGISTEFITKWSAEFKKANKNVIWNLSDNKNLDDTVIDALDFSSIYSLNLCRTSVTDAGLAKIAALLETNGIGKLVCIHLSGAKVTDSGVNSLKTAIQKAVEVWKAKNPGKELKLQGANNSGIVFEKIPVLLKKGAQKSQKTMPITSAVTTEVTTAEVSSEPVVSDNPPVASSAEADAGVALSNAEAVIDSITDAPNDPASESATPADLPSDDDSVAATVAG